jgi:hypothetical protein
MFIKPYLGYQLSYAQMRNDIFQLIVSLANDVILDGKN